MFGWDAALCNPCVLMKFPARMSVIWELMHRSLSYQPIGQHGQLLPDLNPDKLRALLDLYDTPKWARPGVVEAVDSMFSEYLPLRMPSGDGKKKSILFDAKDLELFDG